MENQLVSLGAKFGAAQDQANRQQEIEAAYERARRDNLNLQKELQDQSDYLTEVEQKTYDANLNALNMLRQLKRAELENEALKAYILELKSKVAIYVPIRGD